MLEFQATCSCECGCGAAVRADQVKCGICANGLCKEE